MRTVTADNYLLLFMSFGLEMQAMQKNHRSLSRGNDPAAMMQREAVSA